MRALIDDGEIPARGVAVPKFPVWQVLFDEPVSKDSSIIQTFLSVRESENWLLMADESVAGNRHLWAAWLALERRRERGSMRSNAVDGEFFRLVGGTHHISQGFKRAGLCDGDKRCWLVFLPETSDVEELPDVFQNEEGGDLLSTAKSLESICAFSLGNSNPEPTHSGLIRLGAFEDGDEILQNLREDELEDFFIAHIQGADIFG